LAPRRLALGLVVLLAAFSAGCEKPKVEAQNYVYYPEAPDPPRLQFLVSFSDVKGWAQGPRGSFADFILGDETKRAAGSGAILSPYGIGARDGKLYVCDIGRQCVHVVDMANNSYSRLGDPQQVTQPINIFIDKDGAKYVCDIMGSRIAVFDAQDRFVRHLSNAATCTPLDVVAVGDELFVIDNVGAEIEVWDRAGKYLRTIVTKGTGPDKLQMPNSIAADGKGRLYVSDMRKSIVDVFDTQGRYLGSVGAPGDRPGFFARPKGMAIDPHGRLYVVDSQWDVVQIFDSFDAPKRLPFAFGGPRPTPDGLGTPAGVCIDATSIKAFSKHLAPDFVPEYLVFVTNQFGNNKVSVFAFGKSGTADYSAVDNPTPKGPSTRPAATMPATSPATTAPAR
jgi:DNA-binding beta-propeller fold protein YncE